MNTQELYSIMSTKPHNEHYLKRYLKFIEWCREVNKTGNSYLEEHHILPKAKDMFPEYKSFDRNLWNRIGLTTRQHIIAHVILWKAFPESSSQMIALTYMVDKFPDHRKVPSSMLIRYTEKLRQEYYEWKKGRSTYVDSNGKRFYIKSDDPLIQELNLTHFKTGSKHSDESKQQMSETKQKNPNKKVVMRFLTYKRRVKLYSKDFDDHLAQGWTTYYREDDKEYSLSLRAEAAGESLKGRYNFMYPDGTFYGKLDKDDPIIQELNLKPHVTEKMKKQRSGSFQAAARETLKGSKIYNNGKVEARFKEDPGDEWVKGRLPRSEDHKRKFKESFDKKIKGSQWWTNGEMNRMVAADEFFIPGRNWKRGMTRGLNKRK